MKKLINSIIASAVLANIENEEEVFFNELSAAIETSGHTFEGVEIAGYTSNFLNQFGEDIVIIRIEDDERIIVGLNSGNCEVFTYDELEAIEEGRATLAEIRNSTPVKETRSQKEKRLHRELMNNIIEVRQYDYTEEYKIVVKYASGATRTFKSEPSWFMEYIEDSWSIMQKTFNVYGSYEQIHNNYKPIELSAAEEAETENSSIELNTKLSDSFKNYSKLFGKYGITPADINDLNDNISSGRYAMECTVTRYTKKPGYKTFSGATIESETFNISAEFYYNCITGIAFFHDKVTMGYTYAGNIITGLTCYNPDKTVKMVRTFKIIRNS